MKKLAIVILASICFLSASSACVFAGKKDVTEIVEKEVISAENRGIILHHFINVSLEIGDFSEVSLSYEKPEKNENLELMVIITSSGNYVLMGLVVKGNPVVVALRMKDEKMINLFADLAEGKENKWKREFCSAKCKNGWSDIPGESFAYTQNQGKEISRAMDRLNAKDDQFALENDRKNLKIAYNVSESGNSGKYLVIFSNKKTPLIIHGEIKEGEVKYSSFEFDTTDGSEPSEWFTLPIPDDGQIGK